MNTLSRSFAICRSLGLRNPDPGLVCRFHRIISRVRESSPGTTEEKIETAIRDIKPRHLILASEEALVDVLCRKTKEI